MKPDLHKKFVVGNWKMHTTTADATHLAKEIADGLGAMNIVDRVSVAVCPPFPYLGLVGEILKGSGVALGSTFETELTGVTGAPLGEGF